MAIRFIRPAADWQLSAAAQLLKADDYATTLSAADFLNQARQRAAQIVADAKQLRRSEAERGYREGTAKATEEMGERISATVAAGNQYLDGIEQELADVIFSAVKKIVKTFDGRQLVLELAREALARVRDAQRVKLRVAPSAVEGLQQQLRDAFPEIDFLEVEGDASLAADACVLESELGVVDASLDSQMAALQRSLNDRSGSA